KAERMRSVLQAIANSRNVTMDQVVIAWLLRHPSGICAVMGSGKLERLERAVDSTRLLLSDDDWFRIWIA
ncbi:aldo/keto reductase, partial [Marinomonas arenicola]